MGEAFFGVFSSRSDKAEMDKCAPREILPTAFLVESLYLEESKTYDEDFRIFLLKRPSRDSSTASKHPATCSSV